MGVPSRLCFGEGSSPEGKKAIPSGRTPVCRRRYVGKECERNQGDPGCAVDAEPQRARPIRCSAEVALVHTGKSEGLIATDDAAGQHNLGGGKGPCFSREVFA
jgi:hypothetical protein